MAPAPGPFGKPSRTHRGPGIPWYLHPSLKVWGPDTTLPKTNAPNPRQIPHKELFAWVHNMLPMLDAPEVLVPEMNCVIRDWEQEDPDHRKCRLLIQTPVEYSAAIANMGVAIIYDIANNRNADSVICERSYYPEPKLKTAMLKNRVPLFSKETRRPVKAFDILAFSSYYPLQMLAIPELLELGGMSPHAHERGPGDPLVGLAGVSAFNPAPVHNLIDFAAIGEGEQQVVDMVRIHNEERNGPAACWTTGKNPWPQDRLDALSTKDRILLRWATEVDGIYVPKYYEEIYHPDEGVVDPKTGHIGHHGCLKDHVVRQAYKSVKGPNGKPIPVRVRKAVIDVNKVPPLDRMFVSNGEGEAMSAGSLMIAFSCSNKCYFCQGSFVSQPYRERDVEIVKEGFSNLIQNTGAHAVTPYAFNLSDHSQINTIVHFLMNDESRKVSMSSQRIDYFSPDFAKASFLSGNKGITLAIEGGSQRMRDVISKNLTETMILEAFRTVFEVGFERVKIYMIANLPGEEEEDRLAIVDLLSKIKRIQHEVQGTKPKTQIRVSYTPFTAKNFTPFQWAPGTPCSKETGLPVVERTLTGVIDRVHHLGYKFRVGTNSDLSIVNQCITHGDRRLAPVMMAIYRSTSLNYAGGMSVGKDPLREVQEYLRNTGLDFEFYMRDKPNDEVFPWDALNIRVTKKFLLQMWERSQEATNVAICFDECTKCGACTPESVDHFEARKDASLKPDRADVGDALRFKPKPVIQKLRLRFRVDDDYRYVHGSKIKMRLRRAAIRTKLPIKNEFALASDRFVFQEWAAGRDYAEVALHSRDLPTRPDLLAAELTRACEGAIVVEEARVLSKEAGNFRASFDRIVYTLRIPSANASTEQVRAAFNETLAKRDFSVRLKVKGLQRDTMQTIDYPARPAIHQLLALPDKGGTRCWLVLSDKLSPYDLLPAVFGTSKRAFLKLVVERYDILNDALEGNDDMFSPSCEVCGDSIPFNLFGDPVFDDRCLAHPPERAGLILAA